MKRLLRFLARLAAWSVGVALALWVVLILARHFNPGFRPYYPSQAVMVNENGQCALVQHSFRQLDLFQLGLLLEGDAFYTVIDLQSGNILRDSTTAIKAIYALQVPGSYMQWNGNTGVEFPLDNEWSDIRQCGEGKAPPQFSGLNCSYDYRPSKKPECERLWNHVRRITR